MGGVFGAGILMSVSATTGVSKVGAILESTIYGSLSVFSIIAYIIIFRALLKSQRNTQTNSSDENEESLPSFICKKIKEEG